MQSLSSNLDAIRAIAVCLVVLSHFTPHLARTFGYGLTDYNFATLGHVGVALFFVHTTLVLMMSLERRGGAIPFFIRRFFRIYPLAIFMVLIMVLLNLRFDKPISNSEVIANLLLVQNLTGHGSIPDQLWTLPYELQMYLLLPALFFVARAAGSQLWVPLICIGSSVLGLILFYTVWGGKTHVVSPLHFIPCFMPGVLAYVLARRNKGELHPAVLFGYVFAAALIVPLLVDAGGAEVPILWAICLGLGLLIPACRPLKNLRINRSSNLIATYSYGIYLTHVLAMSLAFAGGYRPLNWLLFAMFLPGLPFVVYRIVERPGMKCGNRLADQYSARISRERPTPIKRRLSA